MRRRRLAIEHGRRAATPCAFLLVGAVGCVDFPDVVDGAGGAGTASSAVTGPTSSISSTSSSSSSGGGGGGGGGASCQEAPAGQGGDAIDCLLEQDANAGNQANLENDGSALVMRPTNGDAWWTSTQGDYLSTSVSGSFAAVVEVTVDGSNEEGGVFEVGGLLVRDTNRWVKFEAGRISPAVGNNLGATLPGVLLGHTSTSSASEHLGQATGGIHYYSLAPNTPASLVGPAWLGLCRHDVEGFSFHFRQDSDWIRHLAEPIPGSQDGGTPAALGTYSTLVDVGLIAGDFNDAGSPDTVATFRHFRVGPLTGALTDCTDTLTDLANEGLAHCGFCVDGPPSSAR